MSKWDKLLDRILSGDADAGIPFDDLCNLLHRLGWTLRVRGSHHVFQKPGFKPLNLQPVGPHAKRYQIAQVRQSLSDGPLDNR